MIRMLIAAALCAAGALTALPASAQAVGAGSGGPRQAAIATASVLVGGHQVAFLGPAAGLTPQERAQRMRSSLQRVVTAETLATFVPGDVDVAWRLGQPVIMLRGVTLITATSVDARLGGEAPVRVAAQWARELRQGLTQLRIATEPGALGPFVAIVPGTSVFHGGGAGTGRPASR